MRIAEQYYYYLIDRVVHEGEPELLLGPITQFPADLPPMWVNALAAPDPRTAIAHLWIPMENRLPRVYRALRERLQGVGLLRTEEVPASLIYFFSDGDYLFQYRGRQPLPETHYVNPPLPLEFLDFYRIHDGWVLFFSEDDGPAPAGQWHSIVDLWPEVNFKMPFHDAPLYSLKMIFRDGETLALAYDVSDSPSRPFVCRANGTVEPLLDMWMAIDHYIGKFLEELDIAPTAGEPGPGATALQTKVTLWDERLLQLVDQPELATPFRGAAWHEQACHVLLRRAWLERRGGRSEAEVVEYYRRALGHWCTSLEKGGQSSPQEVLNMFGLAHVIRDPSIAGFLATLPVSAWADGSVEALQARMLFDLFLADYRQALTNIDNLLGLTFDTPEPVDSWTEIVTRLIESLLGKDGAAFTISRQRAVEALQARQEYPYVQIPWQTKLAPFDTAARRLGLEGV